MTTLDINISLHRTIVPVGLLCLFTITFLFLKDRTTISQLISKDVGSKLIFDDNGTDENSKQKVLRTPRCFWPYYLHGYHSASSADNNVHIDIYNKEHLDFNTNANITASVELKSFHYSLFPDSFTLLKSQSNLFDDCLSHMKYQQLLLISLRQHKHCQLHYSKYNRSQLCALHNARLNSLTTYLPTHFNELITDELTGPMKLNFLLNSYPFPKSKYFNSSQSQNSLFITDPDTVIAVYTSFGMWPMTKVWLLNILKYQPSLLSRIMIGCYDNDVHQQIMEFNKNMSLLKITQMTKKNYSINLIQSLWRNKYENAAHLFIHPEIIEQFVSNLVWSNQIVPSFVVPHVSALNSSEKVNTKTGHSYLNPEYMHMVWGKVTNSHRALENGFTIIIHDTDELSFHDPAEWIIPRSWSDDYLKFICDHLFAAYNTGLVLVSHYNRPIIKWWHGMELNSLNPARRVEDQRAMIYLVDQRTRSVHMDFNGSLITAAAIEKSRFQFRLIQRLNIRMKAKQKLKNEKDKKVNVIDDNEILEFIKRDPQLLKDYQSTFATVCSDQLSGECFYSDEKLVLAKPPKRPKEIEYFFSNLTSLNNTASNYLHTFSHLFIHSNFSTYSFFNSASEFMYYLSLYPSTNQSELAWCPPEVEGYSHCSGAIKNNWAKVYQSIEAGTLLSYHYNCLVSYNDKVNAMKHHGNWIEL